MIKKRNTTGKTSYGTLLIDYTTGNPKQYKTLEVPYQITYQNRSSISIRISEADNMLLVKAPLYTTEDRVLDFLEAKQHWIMTHFLKMIKQKETLSQIENEHPLTELQKSALEQMYREQAKECITQKADYYCRMVGCNYERITLREQKTRWGSCSARKTLSFHWKLILAPPGVLDYVVAHEVSHLVYMDHSPKFWGLVASIMPDYQKYRKWLKLHGLELAKTYYPLPWDL